MTTKQSPTVARKGRPRAFDRAAALDAALDVFWERGYEPASISELCATMGINPPSLYAAFGNKATLFLEAVRHYEAVYWDAAWERMVASSSAVAGIERFFTEAAAILTAPAAPCGCMVVLAAVNISDGAKDVREALKALRIEALEHFRALLDNGIASGELRADADAEIVAAALNTLLEGLSIQARDGASRQNLADIGALAVDMLPITAD